MRDLFDKNNDFKDIIRFKEIYRSVEEAINRCQDVGDIFRQIVVKHG
jgi:uncharacterized protein Yka (UPF0111/DUF47 family)